jgi:hypothetical protein
LPKRPEFSGRLFLMAAIWKITFALFCRRLKVCWYYFSTFTFQYLIKKAFIKNQHGQAYLFFTCMLFIASNGLSTAAT